MYKLSVRFFTFLNNKSFGVLIYNLEVLAFCLICYFPRVHLPLAIINYVPQIFSGKNTQPSASGFLIERIIFFYSLLHFPKKVHLFMNFTVPQHLCFSTGLLTRLWFFFFISAYKSQRNLFRKRLGYANIFGISMPSGISDTARQIPELRIFSFLIAFS
jgi:hypothetical protein